MKSDPPTPIDDALARRYRDAVRLAGEDARPADATRAAILAHAADQARARQAEPVQQVAPGDRPAANDGRWRWRAVASVLLVGFVALLAWQVERADDGSDGPTVALAPSPTPAPAAAPMPAPAAPAADATARAAPPPQTVARREAERARERARAERALREPPRPAAAPAPRMARPAASLPEAATAPPGGAAATQDVPPLRASAPEAAPLAAAPPRPAVPRLQQAALRGEVERVRALLDAGAAADARDARGRTALLALVLQGDGRPDQVEVARLLLEAGADPNAADADGVTPLQHARRRGQDELARLIEAHGGR